MACGTRSDAAPEERVSRLPGLLTTDIRATFRRKIQKTGRRQVDVAQLGVHMALILVIVGTVVALSSPLTHKGFSLGRGLPGTHVGGFEELRHPFARQGFSVC